MTENIRQQKIHAQTKDNQNNNSSWQILYQHDIFGLHHTAQRVFKYIYDYCRNSSKVFPSHQTIAQDIGISIRQVQRILDHLESLKLIRVYRRYYRTHIYSIPDELRTKDMYNRIRFIFKYARSAFLSLSLIAAPTALPKADVILRIRNNEIIYLNTNLPRERDTVIDHFYLPKDIKTERLSMYDFSYGEAPGNPGYRQQDEKSKEIERAEKRLRNDLMFYQKHENSGRPGINPYKAAIKIWRQQNMALFKKLDRSLKREVGRILLIPLEDL